MTTKRNFNPFLGLGILLKIVYRIKKSKKSKFFDKSQIFEEVENF